MTDSKLSNLSDLQLVNLDKILQRDQIIDTFNPAHFLFILLTALIRLTVSLSSLHLVYICGGVKRVK